MFSTLNFPTTVFICFLALLYKQVVTGYVRSNRCYSCMSASYEELFKQGFMKDFYEPRNFTSQCDDPMDPTRIGTVLCRSICLTIVQDFISFGRKTGKKLTIRGCSTSINRYGFFNRTLALFDRYDICKDVTVRELFRYDGSSQVVRVCSCLGDRCNGGRSNAIQPTKITVYITVLLWLLHKLF